MTVLTDGWIQTYTGDRVWPMQGVGVIKAEDIAHALSNICRFGGHTKFHYSVAQHSYYVSQLVPRRLALAGLMHDAAEAYLGDIPRPIKHGKGMDSFRAAEGYMESAIERAFGIVGSEADAAEIKKADNIVLATERRDLMAVRPEGAEWLHGTAEAEPMPRRIMQWTPDAAKRNFWLRYVELTQREKPPVFRQEYPWDGGW